MLWSCVTLKVEYLLYGNIFSIAASSFCCSVCGMPSCNWSRRHRVQGRMSQYPQNVHQSLSEMGIVRFSSAPCAQKPPRTWFSADKSDGVMGPPRLQLPFWGAWGRAKALFLLQWPWNGACRVDWLWKVIACTFIALGGKSSLGKGKEGEKNWHPSPRGCGARIQNVPVATSLFPLLPVPAALLKG